MFDGYIRGAEVFVDTNNNSSLDSDETSVTTDNQGNFTKLLYADGSVISKGGIDLDTGADLSSLTLAHKMVGFEATKIISPITSLAAYMAKPEDINAALGIDASIDLMSVDPIPNLGQSEYDYIYEKGNQLTVIAYSLQNSVNAINQTAETSQDYFLSIAEEIEKEALATLILNKLKGIINLVAIRAPGFGQRRKNVLQDIAILTDGVVITEEAGLTLDNTKIEDLGEARRVVVTKETTTIINEGTNDNVKKHCEQLRKQILRHEDGYEIEQLQDRIAKLSGGVGVIKVGAVTETEMKDKSTRTTVDTIAQTTGWGKSQKIPLRAQM